MPNRTEWSEAVPQILHDAYPDHDLLPIEPPRPDETVTAFKRRAEEAGDTLLLFLCREADGDIDAVEPCRRLPHYKAMKAMLRLNFVSEVRPSRKWYYIHYCEGTLGGRAACSAPRLQGRDQRAPERQTGCRGNVARLRTSGRKKKENTR